LVRRIGLRHDGNMIAFSTDSCAEEAPMRYWYVAFAIALVVVLGHAVGPLGLLIAILAFGVALFLLWADQIGFDGAWKAFGFDRLEAPAGASEIRDRFAALLHDRVTVAKALTITMALTALWLIVPDELMLIGVIVAIGSSAWRINARRPSSPPETITRLQASQRAASAPPGSPTGPALIQHPEVSLRTGESAPSQPIPPAILLTAAPSESGKARSTATVSFMLRGTMVSASSLALLARGRYRKQRVRRGPKQSKRPGKSRSPRKPTRHVPLHLKLPLGRRQIRRPKRTLQSGTKLASRRPAKSD
jgi:hypothetical protein